MEYLNKNKRDNNEINENTKICKIIEKKNNKKDQKSSQKK